MIILGSRGTLEFGPEYDNYGQGKGECFLVVRVGVCQVPIQMRSTTATLGLMLGSLRVMVEKSEVGLELPNLS